MVIAADKLRLVATKMPIKLSEQVATALTDICPKYGINTFDIFHEFIANVLHESAEFTRLEEGLNYQAVALTKLFGRHRISIDDCYRYGRTTKQKANQEAIANIIYGGKWGKDNLGNTEPGDGYNFRGSGPIQTTGRRNTVNFTKYFNKLTGVNYTPEQIAVLLRYNISIGIHSACWIFAVAKQLIDEAISDLDVVIAKKINGGLIGIKERQEYLHRAELSF